MKTSPPKWSVRFLRWFCREDYLDEIEGDLFELFDRRIEKSPSKARRQFIWDVLKSFRLRNMKTFQTRQFANLRSLMYHTLILSFRGYRRNKMAFFINLTGLATGLASALLICLWVYDELQVDKFQEMDARLHRIMRNYDQAGDVETTVLTPSRMLEDALQEEIPGIEGITISTPAAWAIEGDLTKDEKHYEAVGKFVGEDYFKLFYGLEQGNAEGAVTRESIVISEKLAMQIFNTTENVIGRKLEWAVLYLKGEVTVSGIFKRAPESSTDQFDFALHFDYYAGLLGGASWSAANEAETYVLFSENSDFQDVNDKVIEFSKSNIAGEDYELFLQPYSDNYLYGEFENGVISGGRIYYVRLFSIIAVFIIIIACINFMNLSTARASRRLSEIGVKKTIGARRSELIGQHLGESLIISFLALLLSAFMVNSFLPFFNELTGKQMVLPLNSTFLLVALALTVFTGLLAGSYPALHLSRFSPVQILKKQIKGSITELIVRRGLVVFQFVLSIVLIIVVIVASRQMTFIQQKSSGYEMDNIITFEREGELTSRLDAFLAEVKNLPGVVNASSITSSLVSSPSVNDFRWEGSDPEGHVAGRIIAYYDLIETMGVELVQGRSFSRDFAFEPQLVINESTAKLIGRDDPIGMKIRYWNREAKIVGVVKDFHFRSYHEKIGPMFFDLDPRFLTTMVIRINGGNERETITRLEEFYAEFNPGYEMNFEFLRKDFQQLYESETRLTLLLRYFALCAVLISGLGLLGLSMFTTERRLKEIGIRKILGANPLRIIGLLSTDLSKTILLAVVIALPVGYLMARRWLETFAYQIELSFGIFLLTAGLTLLASWLMVSVQTLRASFSNPVNHLRAE